MKMYSVKQLADLSRVSVRTLHHYDKIGLLKPSNRTESNYRKYGKPELLRLQQILFYRELDMSLAAIKDILDDPDFDTVKALESHKTFLKKEALRLQQKLQTIDKTIYHIQQNTMLKPEELYTGIGGEKALKHREEAKERHGEEVIKRAEKHLLKKSKEEYQQLQQVADETWRQLAAMSATHDPEEDDVQATIEKHYHITLDFWGDSHAPENTLEAYAGLAELYKSDERFTEIDGKQVPGFAEFMKAAMEAFASGRKNSR